MNNRINFKSYSDSLRVLGFELREYFSDIQIWHDDISVHDEDSLFYAKGFFRKEITDEIYYFGKKSIKIIELNKDKEQKLHSISIQKILVSEIDETILTLKTDEEIDLLIQFKNGDKLHFNNNLDSDEKWMKNLGAQIKEIYNILIK